MTTRTHSDWLDLAAVETVFPLRPEEVDGLAAHLRDCVDCTQGLAVTGRAAVAIARFDPGPMRSDVRQRIREATMSEGANPMRRLLTALAAFATISIGVVAISIVAVLVQGPATIGPTGGGSNPFNWSTETVRISAAVVGIEANGQLFSADPTATTAISEPGSPTSWTVELRWRDHERELGMYLGFGADKETWWLADVRVLDGVAGQSSKWVALPPGTYLNTPVGRAWMGNFDLIGTGRAGPVAVHIDGATIWALSPRTFAAPPNGGKVLTEGSRPFISGGELHCSGIFQMTPRNAHAFLLRMGYRVSWRVKVLPTAGQAGSNQPQGLGAAVDAWELRIEPPNGLIVDLGVPVTSDGAVVLSVLSPADPDAHQPPWPGDCPGGPLPSATSP